VARLPEYLRILVELAEQKLRTVSSGQLAGLAGVNAAKVRKDLSHLGTYGTRGVGYDVDFLLFQVRQALGLTRDWPTVVVGAGNLGRALANYAGFSERGFPVVGVLDADPAKIGTMVGPFRVRPVDDLADLVAGHESLIGIIATPPPAAQEVAELLVANGVTAILNFAPRKVDLALELQILSFYQRQQVEPPPVDEPLG